MTNKPVMIASGYLPLSHRGRGLKASDGWVLRLPIPSLAWLTCLLPLSSFVFCVVWSLIYNFEDSTFTHCKVPNFLPSISAAIGNYKTQRLVWGAAIAVHAVPRFLFTSMYRKYYRDVLRNRAQRLATLACALNIIENIALIGLTFIPSAYNYAIHEKCFMTFMVTSELYMVLTCILLTRYREQPADNVENRSLRLKYQLLAINMVSFALAGYFFIRHNLHCEPGVYSLFALCEYVVVLTNMAFHMTASWDFHGRIVTVDQFGIDIS
ncbi:post-GPI attachment to proteins factor 2 [Nilaparvata lugens]|uniref:post-GPI attachment to proteins factor 2 n=1 Tax=Nilaparvata lugens TaxID=108931 RepID=UPI00193D247E|nr:post-GPI attachment to proteins factor 2 [Nilaparvata lugens]XP_039285234.1 post-GPI attachment to proteins factor 2 [Nilaparvata lugens]